MRPEPFTALHQALRFGPGYCPPDLFEGSVPAIVRGLKVHANNIAQARHIAIADSYPRLANRIGLERFHAIAEAFLDKGATLAHALDRLGEDFAEWLDSPVERDLARAEWAWLEVFNAAEAKALTLTDIASLSPDELAGSRLVLHPAVRFLALEEPQSFAWDEPIAGEGWTLLLTRPEAQVLVRRINAGMSLAGDLDSADPSTLIVLVEAGAIQLER